MKIAIIGYGRMGHMVEQAALSRGHQIVAVIDRDNAGDLTGEAFRSADAAIDFSQPACAAELCTTALRQGMKVVSGTTGWSDRLDQARAVCESVPGSALMWSSNYSIGVNLFRRIVAYASRLMASTPQYTAHIDETHHIYKLDHPSGTAITLAETVIANTPGLEHWLEADPAATAADCLPVTSHRIGEVPGIHIVEWTSEADSITLTHSARSREGFALGAVMAAEWLAQRTGVHSIDEMIDQLTGAAK